MEELISTVISLELEHFTYATLAMSWLGYLQEPAKIMVSGLERHQLVKVSCTKIFCKWRPNMKLSSDQCM